MFYESCRDVDKKRMKRGQDICNRNSNNFIFTENIFNLMAISSRNTLLAALAFIAFQAQAVNVTVAYQTSAEPAKVAQADNTFAKESGATVDWRKFDSGASIVRALASGDDKSATSVPAR